MIAWNVHLNYSSLINIANLPIYYFDKLIVNIILFESRVLHYARLLLYSGEFITGVMMLITL